MGQATTLPWPSLAGRLRCFVVVALMCWRPGRTGLGDPLLFRLLDFVPSRTRPAARLDAKRKQVCRGLVPRRGQVSGPTGYPPPQDHSGGRPYSKEIRMPPAPQAEADLCPAVFRNALYFVLVSPSPGGVRGRVRIAIFRRTSWVLGRFRPRAGGETFFVF